MNNLQIFLQIAVSVEKATFHESDSFSPFNIRKIRKCLMFSLTWVYRTSKQSIKDGIMYKR